jgi:hypothetical protein
MNALLFLHVLAAMTAVGLLIVVAIAAGAGMWRQARLAAIGGIATTIVAIGLGEGLAADEDAAGTWLDTSRGLAVFGVLLGAAALIVVTGLAQSRPRWRGPVVTAASLVVSIGLAVAFVMAAKPS